MLYHRTITEVCSQIEVYLDRVKLLDLRLGTAGGGSAPGIIFYDSFEGIAVGGNELSNQEPSQGVQKQDVT